MVRFRVTVPETAAPDVVLRSVRVELEMPVIGSLNVAVMSAVRRTEVAPLAGDVLTTVGTAVSAAAIFTVPEAADPTPTALIACTDNV